MSKTKAIVAKMTEAPIKRGRGRPRKGDELLSETVTVRLSTDTVEVLETAAESEETISDVARKIIERWVRRRLRAPLSA